MPEIKKIDKFKPDELKIDISEYPYQTDLTKKLDVIDSDFNQEIINEIVLWKVNRYALLDSDVLNLINQIKKTDRELNQDWKKVTVKILEKLLDQNQKGVRLAMASTILRFKNPYIYQILDQRVYRIIYGKELEEDYPKNKEEQIQFYLNYLERLREECSKNDIEFKDSDRILYLIDKDKKIGNGNIALKESRKPKDNT